MVADGRSFPPVRLPTATRGFRARHGEPARPHSALAAEELRPLDYPMAGGFRVNPGAGNRNYRVPWVACSQTPASSQVWRRLGTTDSSVHHNPISVGGDAACASTSGSSRPHEHHHLLVCRRAEPCLAIVSSRATQPTNLTFSNGNPQKGSHTLRDGSAASKARRLPPRILWEPSRFARPSAPHLPPSSPLRLLCLAIPSPPTAAPTPSLRSAPRAMVRGEQRGARSAGGGVGYPPGAP